MRRAIIVVDMLNDNLNSEKHFKMTQQARAIIPAIQKLLSWARERKYRVVFANDSFLEEDFIFRGRMEPHCIRGTKGAEVIGELKPEPEDIILPKRRFSAFYKTDLEDTLRTWKVEEVLICGITTSFCVMQSAIDAVACGFYATVLEDCSAAHKPEVHEAIIDIYRESALYPLLKIQTLEEALKVNS